MNCFKTIRNVGVFLFLLVRCSELLATDYGSDTASSIVNPFNVSGTGNYIRSFGCAKNGISLTDATSTLTFQSMYPVAGPITLNGGRLYLDTDLIMTNTATIVGPGIFDACNHTIEFSQYFNNLAAYSSITDVFNLVSRVTASAGITSIDWSYDGNYVAIVTTSVTGNDLTIYSFNGSVLTSVAGANINGNAYSVRWHPSAYYIAVGNDRGNNQLQMFQFTPGPNTLSSTGTVNIGGRVNAVGWQKRGLYLTSARYSGGTELSLFSVIAGVPTSVTTYNFSPDRIINADTLCWAPTGNDNYFAVGTASNGGSNLYIFYFDGATLTVTAQANIGQTITALDWSPTGTYISVGLSSAVTNVRVYEYTPHAKRITEATRLDESKIASSVSWASDGLALAIGLASGASTELRKYVFSSTPTPTLTLTAGIDATTNVTSVRYSPNGNYIMRGEDATTKFATVYALASGSFVFNNANVLLKGNLTLHNPIGFSGNCSFNGNGNNITLLDNGSISVKPNSTAALSQATFICASPSMFAMNEKTSKLKLQDMTVRLNNDTTFGDGILEIADNVAFTGKHTFNFATANTLHIGSQGHLILDEDVTLNVGKVHSLEPITFTDNTSELQLQNATLNITGSGLGLTNGTIRILGDATFDIASTETCRGIIIGDGVDTHDPSFEIYNGATLNVTKGAFVSNTFSSESMKFLGADAQIILGPGSLWDIKRPLHFPSGWKITDTAATVYIEPSAYVRCDNMHLTTKNIADDFYFTGTSHAYTSLITLDHDDTINLVAGNLGRSVRVVGKDNSITGMGGLINPITLYDYNSTLTIDVLSYLPSYDFALNGGKVTFVKDSGFRLGYSFITTGTVDIDTTTFDLGTTDNHWTGTTYCDSKGGQIKLSSNVYLHGSWTFSGNTILSGNNHIIFMDSNASIKVERGSTLEIQNVNIEGVAQDNIACVDDAGQLEFNNSMLGIHDNCFFDRGKILFKNNVTLHADQPFERKLTYSYQSSQTSSIDDSSTLIISDGVRFSIGRYNGSSPTQPLKFVDVSSVLNLNNAELSVTSSGMTLTKGRLLVSGISNINVASTKYDYGLILGDGTLVNDFEVRIEPAATLDIIGGKIFYNDFTAADRINFLNQVSTLRVDAPYGLVSNRNLILQNGTLAFPGKTLLGNLNGTTIRQNNMVRMHDTPFWTNRQSSTHQYGVNLFDDGDFFYANGGVITTPLIFRAGTATIGGNGLIDSIISLSSSSVTLNLQIPTGLGQSVALNGGTVVLQNDVHFQGDKHFTGSGTVNLNGHFLSFGTSDLNITDTLAFYSSSGITFNSTLDLSSMMTFYGECHLNGNGNTLVAHPGGVAVIGSNSTLYLTDMAIKHLGTAGSGIIFTDQTSQLHMSNVYAELDNNITMTIGGVRVDGPTTFGMKGYDWTFDQRSSLTVDGVTLWKDSLGSTNPGTVNFGSGTLSNHLTLLSTGTIKTCANLDSLSNIDPDFLAAAIRANSNAIVQMESGSIGGNVYLTQDHPLVVTTDMTYDGDNHFIDFSIDGDLIHIDHGCTLTLQNVVLRNFTPQCFDPSSGGSLIFGIGTVIELGSNVLNGMLPVLDLSYTWTFAGEGIVLDGCGRELLLNTSDAISVAPETNLIIQNITLSGLSNHNMKCLGDNTWLLLKNCDLIMSSDYTFSCGLLGILPDVSIRGQGCTFAFTSPYACGVSFDAILSIDRGVTFKYDSASASKTAFILGPDATLYLNGCTLEATHTGLKLEQGTLVIDNTVTISSQARNQAEGIELSGALNIKLMSTALLDVYGHVRLGLQEAV